MELNGTDKGACVIKNQKTFLHENETIYEEISMMRNLMIAYGPRTNILISQHLTPWVHAQSPHGCTSINLSVQVSTNQKNGNHQIRLNMDK